MRAISIFLFLVGVAVSANASVAILDTEVFQCSDGKDYKLLRHYWGGWGPGRWTLVAFCNSNTLTQEGYSARYMNARDAHPEVARCQDQETDAIKTCYNEFVSLNGSNGTELTPLRQGRVVLNGNSKGTQVVREPVGGRK